MKLLDLALVGSKIIFYGSMTNRNVMDISARKLSH